MLRCLHKCVGLCTYDKCYLLDFPRAISNCLFHTENKPDKQTTWWQSADTRESANKQKLNKHQLEGYRVDDG